MRLSWIGISKQGIAFDAAMGAIGIAAALPTEDDPNAADHDATLITDARISSNPLSSASYQVPDGHNTGYRNGVATDVSITHVDGFPVEVATARAFEAMRTAAARDGVQLRIVSGFRTMEHQRALYAAYRAGRGAFALRPGYSNHQMGTALDLNWLDPGVLRWLNAHARAFEFRRTVRSEQWHWQWRPDPGVPVYT